MAFPLLFVASLAFGGSSSEIERPTQACSNTLVAELQIARGEWKAAEGSLRYALVFDFEDGYLRERLKLVMSRQGIALAKHHSYKHHSDKHHSMFKKTVRLRLPSRLKARVDQKPIAPSVAEK